eukprot:CAMPEP_0202906726 /NCGR_PEP_ID=MMETSP1392-20130828/40132_1 /ASSEMBLY_ACC=CAM_ASM_000868 /TAXON_ID=225041 /ORGANISM="Chlamydomonas chlamydogama, Strain SAG 11-48b" /LENGTH=104 /DNA_ID=CAMNT_0049595361 /DNA_START=95 /DNA_END=409 /DNA_ORIENTATION=+
MTRTRVFRVQHELIQITLKWVTGAQNSCHSQQLQILPGSRKTLCVLLHSNAVEAALSPRKQLRAALAQQGYVVTHQAARFTQTTLATSYSIQRPMQKAQADGGT